jgi:hypothetical protein
MQSNVVKLPSNPQYGTPLSPLTPRLQQTNVYAVSKDAYFYAELKYSWGFFSRKAYELLQYGRDN